ncbi:MAG: hypothetical protein ACTSYW_00305 [Candidatus Heimdallarchaeota archaeon]
MKKYLVFAFDKESKKFNRYDIYDEKRIKSLPDKDLGIAIEKFNADERNKLFFEQIFDDDVISALTQKMEAVTILTYVESIKEEIQDLNYQVGNLESQLDSFQYKIKEDLGLNKDDK